MNQTLLEWIGYLASAIVLVSLLMNSVIRLRLINLIGSLVFAVYGLMIGSVPVAILNYGIVLINIYYLSLMLRKKGKEYFKILEVGNSSEYLLHFINFYKDDITKFSSFKTDVLDRPALKFFVLRDMVVAGVFICTQLEPGTLKVELDYAVPKFRDFKMGKYIYHSKKYVFIDMGCTKLVTERGNKSQYKYLKKMGFVPSLDDANIMELMLV